MSEPVKKYILVREDKRVDSTVYTLEEAAAAASNLNQLTESQPDAPRVEVKEQIFG